MSNQDKNNILLIKTVQIAPFRTLMVALKDILLETNISFKKDGMRIINMDKSQTILVHMHLHADNFEFYECKRDKIIVGVNMLHLFKLINSIDNEETLSIYIEEQDYNSGYDQLQDVINKLKDPEKRNDRRMVISAWNPLQINEMALPPCHVLFQFHVTKGNKLSCTLYQRSGDVGLGVPFNIFSYAAFTVLIAKHCDLEPYEFIYYLGNTHIYVEHIESLKEQINRTPYKFPTIQIKQKRDNINDYVIEDFIIEDYNYHKTIKMKMIQ